MTKRERKYHFFKKWYGEIVKGNIVWANDKSSKAVFKRAPDGRFQLIKYLKL